MTKRTKTNKQTNKKNIEEFWDTMEIPNLRIIGIEDSQLKGLENIFNKTRE